MTVGKAPAGRPRLAHAAALLLVAASFWAERKGLRGVLSGAVPLLLLGALLALRVPQRTRWAAIAACAGSVLLFRTEHVLLLIGLSALVLASLDLLAGLRASLAGRPAAPRSVPRPLLVLGSALATLVLAEAALVFVRGTGLVESPWILPAEFEIRSIEGSKDYYWHGALHRFNAHGFRGPDWPVDPTGAGPASAAPRGRFRIAVLGDSLTYGYGVKEDQTYSEDLRRRLAATHRVEVLNLGVSGNQSEETLALAKRWLPKLRPDLVVYGHCLNDFLPSEISRYTRYDIPLPHRVKRMFRRRTLIGGLAYYGYGQLLIALGLEADFYDDILDGIEAYDHRFTKDVRELNDLAVTTTGHPVLALVLNQMPANPRGRRVASLAETRMREGGMIVAPADPYQDEYAKSGISLKVSIWEGHPNALAHAVYAGELAKAILTEPSLRHDLDRFRLTGPEAGQEKSPDASRTAGPEEDLEPPAGRSESKLTPS